MKILNLTILAILCLLPQQTKGFDLPFFSSPEKEAQSFVDEVVPKIVTGWEEKVLAQYAHPEFYQSTPRNKVEEYFFSFRALGPLQKYYAAKGEIMEIKTSIGRKYITGNYIAEVNFEKGDASVQVSVIKDNNKWMITAIFVDSDKFSTEKKTEERLRITDKQMSEKEMLLKATTFLEEQSTVGLRRSVDTIFPIAERLATEGKKKMALQLYNKALTADPANLDRQLDYAKLLLTEDRKGEAVAKLHLINEMAEDANLLAHSGEILVDLGHFSPQQSYSSSIDAEIILVPVGNPNPLILIELCSKLQEAMKMKVYIEGKTVSLGEPERKLADRYITSIYQNVNGKLSTLQREAIWTSLSLDESSLQYPINQSRYLIKFFSLLGAKGNETRKNFETNLRQMGNEGQYDIERLSNDIRHAISFDVSDKTKVILGVTEKSLFMGEGNFLYGGTAAAYGTISYYHFRAAINQEKQNRRRLLSAVCSNRHFQV